MIKVINLEERRIEKNFNPYEDPCSSCKKSDHHKINHKNQSCTCEKADLWWRILANRIKGIKSE